jgi:CHAT domain-containing protein
MKRLYKIILFLFFIAGPYWLHAQEPARTETREIWITISDTYQQHDSIIAMLQDVKNIGLVNGLIIKAYQSPAEAVPGVSPKKEFEETGSGFITVYEGTTAAFVRMYKPNDTLVQGDMIQVRVQVPVLPYRSIFSELAFGGLIFSDAKKEPLFSLEYLLYNDSRKVEDSIFSIIVKSLQNTYELVKDRTDLPPSMHTRVKEGRFANRIPLEIIRDVTAKELEAFFLYIKAYPVGYMGKNFRASESFAGWLVSNSPFSVGEVKQALFPWYKNKAELSKRIALYKRDMLSEHTASQLAAEATELSDKLKFEEAHELADFAIALAEALNDTASKPTAYICKAQVYLDQDKYTEAITWCDKATAAAIPAKDRDIEMQAIIKKGFCQYKISKYRETEQTLKEAERRLELYHAELGEKKYNNNLRKIFEYRSSISYKSGRYEEALRLLDSAVSFNNRINSYDANITNAGYYTFTGKVYNEQGRPSDALTAFEKAYTIYRNNSDVLNRSIVENEIAYSHFKLGNYRTTIEKAESAMQRLLKWGDASNAGYSKNLAASAYREMGMYDSALVAQRASIELRTLSGNLEGQAISWKSMGELYKLSGSKKLSLQAYDTAQYFYIRLKDSAGMADVYNAKGQVYLDDENYKRATEWFERAKGISPKSTVEALYKLGASWSAIDTAKARKYFTDARLKSKADGNTAYRFAASKSLAMMAYREEDTLTGDKYYDECMALSRQMNTAYSQAACLSLKGYRFEAQTELDSALQYYHQSMAITDTADITESISSLNSIANVHTSKGEFAQAEAALNRAMQLAEDMSDSLSLGSTMQFASFVYSLTADFDKGMQLNDNALSIFRKSGMMLRLASAYASRGVLLTGMGDNKNSILSYLYADSLYRDELQDEQHRTILNNIAVVYNAQGDYARALKYLQQSLGVSRKSRMNEGYLLARGNIAEALVGLKRTDEAKALLLDVLPKTKQLKLNRVASGMALVLGKIYLDENNLVKATEYFTYAGDYAKESGEQEKRISALISLSRIYTKENKTAAAKNNLEESVLLTRKYRIMSGWQSYYELGLLYYNQRQHDSAIANFKQAVELLDKSAENLYGGEEARKLFNNDPRKADLYNKIVFSYYNLGNIKEAWTYANRSSIAGIKELSGSLSVNSGDEERNEALRKLLAMQQSKKALENALDKQEGQAKKETLKKIEILEADYNNFLQDVVVQYPELSTYFSRSNADEFNNYKGKLPDDVAVALYLQNGNTLMIFTLTNEKLAVDTMTVNIAPKISAFISTIKNTQKQTRTGPLSERSEPQDEEASGETGDFKTIADELYTYLISTVEDKIGTKKRLCIMPTGVFSNMPFQCLGRNVGKDQFRFLLEDHPIFYTNKMSVFNKREGEDTGNRLMQSFAAFGVPDAKLQYNISEVKTIGKILGADSTIYTDGRATESMAKYSLRNKKYIHFATHGVLNYSSDYSQSYLKLLPDKDTADGNNGQLTMREVQRLGIKDCDMVILSACQTAVAKELVEGWSISPANSFLVSHVKSVVASLWKVADEPTGLLMEYFYENLRAKMDKTEALRQAQIKLSQDVRYRHPNYWGAFVLYGEWR